MKFVSILAVALIFFGCGSESSKNEVKHEEVKKEAVKPAPAEPVKEVQKVEIQQPKESVKEAAPVLKEEPKKVAVVQKTVAPTPLKSGKNVFQVCSACHGADGTTKALGKSEPIKGWSAQKVAEALEGYKAGTRNIHGMGAVMKAQAAKLSKEDIKLVADYISKL